MADSIDVRGYPGGLPSCLEAVVMAAQEPLEVPALAAALRVSEDEVRSALEQISDDLHRSEHGYELLHTANGWQFMSKAAYADAVQAVNEIPAQTGLSQASLEALAIVAYEQPVTRAQISAIRGIGSDGVVRSLIVRGLVEEHGVEPDSHAALLVTTGEFLDGMGIDDVQALPSLAPFMPPPQDVIGHASVT